MFQMQFIFPVDDPVAAAEILYNNEFMATVYEKPDGWKIDLYQSPRGLDLDEFLQLVGAAKERLAEYTNRRVNYLMSIALPARSRPNPAFVPVRSVCQASAPSTLMNT